VRAPAKFVVEEVGHTRDVRHIKARLLGAKGVQCLDARPGVRSDVTGNGQLVQILGIVKGSRKAVRRPQMGAGPPPSGEAALSISAEGIPPAF
jgi:hypothetical protein